MEIERLVISKLRAALRNEGLSDKIAYEEDQIRPVLLEFLASLQEISSEICKPFNSFALLCALQHHMPEHIIKPKLGFEGDAQILFNSAASLAFRFSSSTKEAEVRFTPADYEEIAEKNDLSRLENYAEVVSAIYYITNVIDFTIKRLRCIGKGSKAIVNQAMDEIHTIVKVDTPLELQQKVSQYDERLIRNQDILIHQAIPVGIMKPESPLKCIVVNPNWDEYRKGDMNPPPVPVVFGMDAIYTFASFHSEEVIKIFNKRAHIEDLFVFIAAMFKPLVADALNNKRFAGQGYSFTEEQHLVDYICGEAPTIYGECFNQQVFPEGTPFVFESLSEDYWREVVPPMLSFICHDFKSRGSIDLLLFSPVRFAYRCDDNTVFIHLGSVVHFFAYFLNQFEKTGRFGAMKGEAFEIMVSTILESIPGFKRIWEPGHKIEFPVAGKNSTDVDVFVQKDELAFLISCKSYGVNREYEMGTGQQCWDRSENAKSWLRFAHEVAKAVAEHHKELQLPVEIKYIIPFVCTGWPEYLFDPCDQYFMADGTPRIATIREIEQFCGSVDSATLKQLLSDQCIVPISHHSQDDMIT